MGNCCTTNPEPEFHIQSELENTRLSRKQQMAEFNEIGADAESKPVEG